MRTILLAFTIAGCDADLSRPGAIAPAVCDVCALDPATGAVDAIECPGETRDGWCAYLGCDVACLPDGDECERAATCGQRPTQQ